MHIVHIHWSLATGGTETMLVDIINEQVKVPNIKVSLIVINNDVYEPIISQFDKKCNLYLLNRKIGSKNPWHILKLNAILYFIKPNIIHIHAQKLIKYIYNRCIKVRTIHSVLNDNTEYHKYKKLYCISEAVNNFTKGQGFSNATTITNGIKTDSIKIKCDYNSSYLKIVQVSRLIHKHKGQHTLIEAIDILINQRGITNISVDFIGEGDSLSFLKEMCIKKNLEKTFHFLGQKDRAYIYSHLCDYNLFIQPSISEGFGLTIAEAMAAKIPIIVSDIDAPMEIIKNGDLGVYFKTGNPVDLADKIESIIRNGYDMEMLNKAYEHVLTMYDISITAKKYIKEYQDIYNL